VSSGVIEKAVFDWSTDGFFEEKLLKSCSEVALEIALRFLVKLVQMKQQVANRGLIATIASSRVSLITLTASNSPRIRLNSPQISLTQLMSWTDSWGDARPVDLTLHLGLASNPNTPSKDTPTRSSRARGNVNLTHYDSFERVHDDSAHRKHLFSVGDAVIVSEDVPIYQPWLVDVPLPDKKKKGASKKRRTEDEHKDPPVDDGLPHGARVAIIAGLHEDEKEHMKATLRWLARPRIIEALENRNQRMSMEEGNSFEKVYRASTRSSLLASLTCLYSARALLCYRPSVHSRI
jgi:hypothetical protein